MCGGDRGKYFYPLSLPYYGQQAQEVLLGREEGKGAFLGMVLGERDLGRGRGAVCYLPRMELHPGVPALGEGSLHTHRRAVDEVAS